MWWACSRSVEPHCVQTHPSRSFTALTHTFAGYRPRSRSRVVIPPFQFGLAEPINAKRFASDILRRDSSLARQCPFSEPRDRLCMPWWFIQLSTVLAEQPNSRPMSVVDRFSDTYCRLSHSPSNSIGGVGIPVSLPIFKVYFA